MAQHSQHDNPALTPLEGLVGEWEMELSQTSFLPDPSDRVRGPVLIEWVQDGAFLAMRMGDKQQGPPQALWLISRDDSTPNYTVLYYDARSVSRVYQMSFSGGVWKMWRGSPGFWQRYEGTVSSDGKTITAHWEKSSDGTTWEHDFDLTYTKISQATKSRRF
jgi:hypothetical protein